MTIHWGRDCELCGKGIIGGDPSKKRCKRCREGKPHGVEKQGEKEVGKVIRSGD